MTLSDGEKIIVSYMEKFGDVPPLTFVGMSTDEYLAVAAKCKIAIERGKSLTAAELADLEPQPADGIVF